MEVSSESKSIVTKEQLLDLYRKMFVIRRTEETLAKAHQRGLIHGACHTYVGEEAIASGVCANLRDDDVVFSTHRGHGHALAKGVTSLELIAELLGRDNGCSRGRGGSMHIFSPEVGMMGTSGIVGPCILQAAGGGYSFKLLKTDNVSVAFFGDGATNNGAFHEGINLAAIWKLPVLFVCENNQYATEIPFSYSSSNPDVGSRGASYNIPGHIVDGNDVLAVYETAREAVRRARAGEGPSLIECKSYRTRPHAEGMGDFTYRTPEEVEQWKTRDPIGRLGKAMVAKGAATQVELDAIEAEIRAQVDAAYEEAQNGPYPDGSTASDHIYASSVPEARAPSQKSTRELNFMESTLEALDEEMARDPKIFVFGEGIGKRGGNFNTTLGLYDKYGAERLCDTPIAERGFIGMCTGAAMTGTRPIVDFMFIDFALDAMGEMLNQIAKVQYMSSGRLKMPIVLRGACGILSSAATHHSGSYYPTFVNVPGFRVVLPSSPYEAKGLFKTAVASDDPVLFLEHRGLLAMKTVVPEEEYYIPFGEANVVREGDDATVVALSVGVQKCVQAADELAKEGASIEVIDPRTLAPLDIDTILESVTKTGRLLIFDENFGPCGVGAEIAAQVIDRGFDDLDAPIRRLNGVHTPTPYSPSLEQAVIPSQDELLQTLRDLLAE